MNPVPLFSEGALKSHFSWHILTRGNAFDFWEPEIIKEATRRHPLEEAKFVAQDFTSINFGWINYVAPDKNTIGMQPDMFEYICSRGAAWDCPISLVGHLDQLKLHPRTADNLEIIRHWEDARLNNFFTDEQKKAMRNPEMEHILLVDETGRFELQPYEQIHDVAQGNPMVRAFIFNRSDKLYVVYWNTSGEGEIALNLDVKKIHLFKRLGNEIPVTPTKEGVIVPLGDRHFLEVDLDRETVFSVFRNAKILF